MKFRNVIALLTVILCMLSINSSVFSQTNSVRLDGTTFFSGIKAAYNSLGGSISSPHVIEMFSNYNGAFDTIPLTLTPKTGSSAVNTITIRPAFGVPELTISPVSDELSDYGLIFNLPSAVFIFAGADYTIIDGRSGGVGSTINLTIKNTSTDFNSGIIEMKNGANNNTVKYVNCYAPGASGGSTGGRNISVAASTPGTGGNNNNTIDHCIVNGGRRGVQTFGTVGVSGYTNNNTIITNNIIKNQTHIGIFLGSETIGNKVISNEVYMDTLVQTASPYFGILCQGVGNVAVRSNRIYNLHSSAGSYDIMGIRTNPTVLTAPGSNTCKINIINNFVSLVEENASAASVTGIDIVPGSTDFTCNIYNNSLRTGGVAGNFSSTSKCLNVFQPRAGSIYDILNNVLLAERSGGNESSVSVAASYTWDGVTGNFMADYNNYGTPAALVTYINSKIDGFDFPCIFATLFNTRFFGVDAGIQCKHDTASSIFGYQNSFCSLGIEQHSNFKAPVFISGTNLHLDSTRVGGDMNGIHIDSVTADIDGQLKNFLYPYRGADEGPKLKVLTVRAVFEGITVTSRAGVIINRPYQIRDVLPPYKIKSTACGDLDNQSNIRLCFGDSIAIAPDFFVVVKQRNHLETWSSTAIHFAPDGTNTYIFDNALSNAYGNNMAGNAAPYRIFGGDVNQNGVIDIIDLTQIENDSYNFETGCNLDTDVNNDGFTDLIDLAITDFNTLNYVSLKRP